MVVNCYPALAARYYNIVPLVLYASAHIDNVGGLPGLLLLAADEKAKYNRNAIVLGYDAQITHWYKRYAAQVSSSTTSVRS